MATTKFTVKRSSTGGDPALLGGGELAYSSLPADSSNGGDRLYIGTGVENDSGNAASHTIIGGKYYTDMLGGAGDIRGTLTTNSALIADSNSEIDQIKVSGSADIGNITIDSSAITTSVTDADLKLSPNGSGNISVTSSIIPTTDGTIDLGTPDNKFGTLYLAGATLVLGDLSLSDSGGSLSVKTTEGGTPATLDLSGSTTDELAEGSTNLYYTEDRFNASITSTSTDEIPEGGDNLYFNISRFDARFDEKIALANTNDLSEGPTNLYYTTARHDSDALVFIDSAYVQARQSTTANIDSAATLALIDTTYIRSKVDASYIQSNQITYNNNDFADSAFVTTQINNLIDGAPGTLDTLNEIAAALNNDDSAYATLVNLIGTKTDYDSTNTIGLVDSAYVQARQLNFSDLLDSSEVIQLVDSAYVQARQTAQDFAYSSLTGVPDLFDSSDAVILIDSAYVQARQSTSGIDSAATLALIDAAYIQSNQITYNNNDFADSAFVTSRPVSTFTNDVRYLDSTTVQAVINSSYVQARQDFAYASLTGAPNVLDSADVVSLVTANSTDSAVVISIVDSAYVQLRQDYSYSSLTGKPDFVDSSDVQNIVDSAYVRTLLDSGFSVTGNITVGGELTVGTLNFTGAGSTTWSSDNELIFTATDRVLIDSAPFRVATMTTADISSITLPENGDMLYNATTNKFQGYENGAWINLALDSSGVTNIVDSAYVQARQTASGVDSAATIALVDSAYIELRRPPEAVFSVVNNGASDYTFSGDGFPTSENDPTIYLTRGLTYKFNVNASGHPFWIKTAANTGTGNQYNDGVTNNGTQSGTILFTVPFDAPTTLYYICQYHSGMVGTIKIIDETSYLDSSEANALIDAAFTAKSTDNLSEGSTNLYYTAARADSDAKNAISGGTGVTVTNGEIAIGQAVGTADSVTFSGLTVSGDLVVTGTTTETNTIVYTVQDPLIHLADSNETSDVLDIGFIGHYYRDGQRRHTGFFRDASDQQYYLYNNLVDSAFDSSAPPNVVNRSGTGFQLASLNVGTLSGHYLGFDSDFSAKSTTNLSEGSNLYYTTARHDSDTLAQVDNTYVRARQDYAYSSLTGIPDLFDSSDATLLVDSAYVQLRQDYAYSSLTGAPNVLDSADVTSLVTALSTDSAAVFAIVDSAYVQLRQDYAYSSLTGAPTTVSSFTNDANYLDSTTATSLIDSAYIQLRQTSAPSGVDSAAVTALVDSAYVQLRQAPGTVADINDIQNVDTSGKSIGSILVYNGNNWVIDQNLFGVEADGGDAFFIDEGIADDGGNATSTYTTSDRLDGGTAYAA